MPKKKVLLKPKIIPEKNLRKLDENVLQEELLKMRTDLLKAMDTVIIPRDQQRTLFADFKIQLKKSKIVNQLGTREIDAELINLCNELQEALSNGDELAQKYIMQAFVYGIFVGHEPFSEDEDSRKIDIMRRRLRKIEYYQELSGFSVKFGKLVNEITKLRKEYEALKKEYNIKGNDALVALNAKREEYEEIHRLGGNRTLMNPRQLQLVCVMEELFKLYDAIENVSETIGTIKKELDTIVNSVHKIELRLGVSSEIAREKLKKQIKNMTTADIVNLMQSIKEELSVVQILNDLECASTNIYQAKIYYEDPLIEYSIENNPLREWNIFMRESIEE